MAGCVPQTSVRTAVCAADSCEWRTQEISPLAPLTRCLSSKAVACSACRSGIQEWNKALETGNADHVVIWVTKEDEREVRALFEDVTENRRTARAPGQC
ncbi:MAG: DUF6448 family protein [Alphaproteobacteria bacterium]